LTPKPKGIAARAGHWSARHRKTAIFGWLAAIVIIFMVGQSLGQKTPTQSQSLNGDSRKAMTIVDDAGFPEKSGEMVLVQSKSGKASDPAFKAAVADVTKTVSAQKVVTNVVKPQISKDKHSALVQFDLKGDPETADERVGPVLDATAAVAKRHQALDIEQYGDASFNKAIAEKSAEEESRGMMLTLISTLVILFLVFGALVAATVPLLLAVTAVFGTGGLVAIASQLMPIDDVAQAAIFLIGLAVGVDYSLFYIRRQREERAKGHSTLDAIDIAAATSGRAVLLSGLTVMAAMGGMLLTDNSTFMSMGVSTILVVAVAVIGSLTVLPAVVAGLGDKLDKGRLPFLGRRQSQARDSRL